MIKKFAVLLTAGIFFLTPPTAAQATGHFSDEPTVNEPFVDDEVQPLTEEEYRRIFGDDNVEPPPPVKPEPPPVEDDRPLTEEEFRRIFGDGSDEPTPPPVEPINPPPVIETPTVDDGEGLEFLMYNQNGMMAFAIIADHEKYQLKPVLARGQIYGRATVSQMNAPDAIATINASYFAANGTLYGNTRIDGITAGTTYYIRSAIGIRADGSTIFGRQGYRGVLQFNGNEVVISGVNSDRTANSVIVYNFLYGVTTGTNNSGLELVVDNGEVVNISRGKGDSYIPPNGFVVSAHGTAIEQFNSVSVGDRIIFDEDFINVENGADFNEALHILGAGPTLIKRGEVFVTADAEQFPPDIRVGRAPRSAVGVTKYGDYIFAVVDGRQAHSKGCTLDEWARILKFFGAVEAINLDGGGSTELIFKGSLVNKPSDGKERPVGDALTIVRR